MLAKGHSRDQTAARKGRYDLELLLADRRLGLLLRSLSSSILIGIHGVHDRVDVLVEVILHRVVDFLGRIGVGNLKNMLIDNLRISEERKNGKILIGEMEGGKNLSED